MINEIYYKYKIFLIPAVVSVICIAILIFVVYPQAMGYFQEINKIDVLRGQVTTLDNKVQELQNIDEETMKKNLATTLTVLPTERDVPRAMSSLKDLITRSNLVLKSTTYSPQAKVKGGNSFGFTVSVLGSLSSIRNFLSELQSGSRIFKVESISLNFQDTSSLVEADIPLTVYYEPVPKTLVTLDQPVPVITDKDQELIGKFSQSLFQSESQATFSANVPLGKVDPFE